MNSTNVIESLENNIKEAEKLVELGTAVDRLRTNKDFKRVVLDGYFKDEAVRLVMLKADPNMQSTQSQDSIVKQMDAIGALNGYLMTIKYFATQAARGIEADSNTIEELLAEGGE